MMEYIDLKTQRLSIRRLVSLDAKPFFQYRSMPEIYTFQCWRPKTIEDAAAFAADNEKTALNAPDSWLQLAVCLPDGRLIGDIGIHFMMEDPLAEIGFTLSPDYQGQGYASEAVQAVIDTLFAQKKQRLIASVDPDNVKSRKLLERLGFKLEAIFEKSCLIDGQWYDDCIYTLNKPCNCCG